MSSIQNPRGLPSSTLMLLLTAMLPSTAAAICYVEASGSNTNSGASWSAPLDLKSALLNPACKVVWVAAGVYKPSGGPFNLNPGVEVYGGFEGVPGSEGNLSVRDPAIFFSVLSGDVTNDDIVDANGITVSYTDVVGVNAYLFHLAPTAPMLADTVLDGLVLTGGRPAFECRSQFPASECSPTLRNLLFIGNVASALVIDVGNGGSARLTLSDSTFRNNSSNNFGISGGAVYLTAAANGVDNSIYTNVTFAGNHALGNGGAIHINVVQGGATPAFRHVTFVNNSAGGGGGAISAFSSEGSASARVVNSILWGNTAPTSPNIQTDGAGAVASLYRSIVQNGCPVNTFCANLVGGDPQLGPLQDNGGFTPTMMPGVGGAAMNAASLGYCTPTDQRGVPRPYGAGCELGAVENTDTVFRNGFD